MTFDVGSQVGSYRLESILGRGGMGLVYRARDLRLNRDVAIKVVQPQIAAADPSFGLRFAREAELAAAIEHPHVVPVYEAGEHEDVLYVVMRLIPGSDLGAVIAAAGRLETTRALRIVSQIASALDAAHARGLVHRDVKPANVLVARADGADHAYLTDFGLTRSTDVTHRMTASGAFVGTTDYAAPEQIEGERVDARTDVYALGCVMFEMLAGRPPFDRPTPVATAYAHLHVAPPALPDDVEGAPVVGPVLERALAKDPAERFPSAGDLARAASSAFHGRRDTQPERLVARGEAAPQTVVHGGTGEQTVVRGPRETVESPKAPPPPWRRRAVALAAMLAAIGLAWTGATLLPFTDVDEGKGEPERADGGAAAAESAYRSEVAELCMDLDAERRRLVRADRRNYAELRRARTVQGIVDALREPARRRAESERFFVRRFEGETPPPALRSDFDATRRSWRGYLDYLEDFRDDLDGVRTYDGATRVLARSRKRRREAADDYDGIVIGLASLGGDDCEPKLVRAPRPPALPPDPAATRSAGSPAPSAPSTPRSAPPAPATPPAAPPAPGPAPVAPPSGGGGGGGGGGLEE